MAQDGNVTINISTMSLVKVIIVALLLLALFLIRDVILTLVVAVVIASALDPLVDWLYRRAKFPRGLSVILVYVAFIGLAATIIYFVIPPIIIQFKDLTGRLDEFRAQLSDGSSTFVRVLNDIGVPKLLSSIKDNSSGLASNVFQTTLGVFNIFTQGIAVLAISFYLISSENGMKNLVKSLAPFKHQAYAVRLTDKVQTQISRWLVGQLVLSFSIFLPTYIGLTLLGVKFALSLGLLAGLFEIIPLLGPILSAIPAIFVAFVQSPPLALFVVLLYIVIQQVENYVLVPKIMGRTVGANPIIILLAVLVGFKIAGILGILLAVPIVAAVGVFVNDFREVKDSIAHAK